MIDNYEAVKAQVLEELKAERKARAEERARVREAAYHMFDETKKEYLPKLVVKISRRTGRYDRACECESKIDEAIFSTLRIMGEKNRLSAYLNGRVEEANQILQQLLKEILEQ